MGWTYYEYLSQPSFFIEAVIAYMQEERKAQLKAIEDSKKKR